MVMEHIETIEDLKNLIYKMSVDVKKAKIINRFLVNETFFIMVSSVSAARAKELEDKGWFVLHRGANLPVIKLYVIIAKQSKVEYLGNGVLAVFIRYGGRGIKTLDLKDSWQKMKEDIQKGKNDVSKDYNPSDETFNELKSEEEHYKHKLEQEQQKQHKPLITIMPKKYPPNRLEVPEFNPTPDFIGPRPIRRNWQDDDGVFAACDYLPLSKRSFNIPFSQHTKTINNIISIEVNYNGNG